MSLKVDHKKNYQQRRRTTRLQKTKSGGYQLPSVRGGPVVMEQVEEDPDFSEFFQQGFRVKRNRKNKFVVGFWHYTEDPEKRDPKFEQEGREENPLAWDQEMELDFSSKRGIRIFSEFLWRRTPCDLGPYWSSTSPVIMPMEAPPDWWLLYLTTDPGRRAAWATLHVLVDEYGCWHVVKSLVKKGLHYSEAKVIIAKQKGRRPVQDHIIDPASKQRRTDSLQTLIEKMADPPYATECTPVDHLGNEWMELEELRERMMKRPDGRYGVYFWDTPANQECISHFKNAVYKDDLGESMLSEDVDAVDALKYLATHMIDRPVIPKKPPEAMSAREWRIELVRQRKRRLERDLTNRQRAATGGVGADSYHGDPI